ncbi:MAG: CvpA family protein [Deltaproteobacteria bacterium]|nr:CvpA family protein [Deltaproteobacteria bacterium]
MMQAYQIIDIVVILILLFRSYKGYRRGIINEIARLFAIIFGVIGSVFVAGFFSSLFTHFIKNPAILGFVALATGFIFIVVCILFAGWIATKLIEAIYLGFINKILGLLFGLLNGAIFCSIIIYLMFKYDILQDVIRASNSGKLLIYILGLE